MAQSKVKPKILYEVAKAAWEGKLLERREEICSLVCQEFPDQMNRIAVANQIRVAMGLSPQENGDIFGPYDEEALMGNDSDPVIVVNPNACRCCSPEESTCMASCPLGAIKKDSLGRATIDASLCHGEGHCLNSCAFEALSEKSQFVPLIKLLKEKSVPVYVSLAPAFAGQFGPDVTAGKLRTALLRLGFSEVLETALYADLITMKEAFEFNDHVKTVDDFLITSCCCPVWIKLIENKFPQLVEHISPSVSPMVASARVIKFFNPTAKVVFIGPCVAKKSEATLPDLAGAVDFVLTFQELSSIFAATEIDPASEEDVENSIASWGGRIYAHTGGVSAAVEETLTRLVPKRAQKMNALQIDGIPACQQALQEIADGKINANFIEGMACKGGCVGGPGRILSPEAGRITVTDYANEAVVKTPAENPQVYSILNRLGYGDELPPLSGESPMATLLARKLKHN